MNASSAFFHAIGYLRVPELLTAGQVETLGAAGHRLFGGSGGLEDLPDWRRRIDNAVSADPVFATVATSEQMVRALRPVLGPDIELVENRHNHVRVYPVATADRLHRDVLQWSRSVLTVLIYLTDCTDTAAATRVVPGSHLWPSTGAPNNGGTWLDQARYHAELVDQAVTVPARAGDVMFMHGQLYHAGAGASVAGPRIVFTLAYRSVDELARPGPETDTRSDAPTDAQESPPHVRLIAGRRVYRGRGAVHHEQS